MSNKDIDVMTMTTTDQEADQEELLVHPVAVVIKEEEAGTPPLMVVTPAQIGIKVEIGTVAIGESGTKSIEAH